MSRTDDIDIFGYNLGGSVGQMMGRRPEIEVPDLSPAQMANIGAAFADPLGLIDISGEFPEFPAGDVSISGMVMEGPRSPSLAENLREGNYGSAVLQGIGVVPVVGGVMRAARGVIKGADRLERAKKAGFDTDTVYYHATDKFEGDSLDFTSLKPSERGKLGPGIYVAQDPRYTEKYIRTFKEKGKDFTEESFDEGARILPVFIRGKVGTDEDFGAAIESVRKSVKDNTDFQLIKRKAQKKMAKDGFSGFKVGSELVIFNPKDVRSVNAVFEDPKSAELLKANGGEIRKFSKGGIVDLILKGAFDPRFDPRVKEQDMLRNLEAEIVERADTQPMPGISLSELEGEDFVTSMTDRTRAGADVRSINRIELIDPIYLPGGQGFMFNNPSAVWSSGEKPSREILEMARELKSKSGKDPLYIPWRMAPTGGDFATTTGELMLGYAASNMTKATKKALDKAIRDYRTTGSMKKGKRVGAGRKIEGWKGLDDPSSVQVWRNTPDAVRKELMNMMDVEFRNKGGLSIGAARLINADPTQLVGRDAGIQNVGRIFADIDIFESDHPSYPFAVPGSGVGVLRKADEATVFDLLPEARFGASQKKVKDPANPTAQEVRALQMKPYGGTITEKILRRMEARGVDINSIAGLSGGALTFTLIAGGLVTPQEAEAGVIKEFAERMMKADQMGLSTDQILYHGSTFDIEKFVPSPNTDNDFGTGTYLTISPSDASRNYAGEGPDLTNRINTLSESIQDSLESDWDLNPDFWNKINDPEVFAKVEKLVDEFQENRDSAVLEKAANLAAKTILKGQNEGVIYPVFVNNNDFAVIGGKNKTVIDLDREQYYDSAREELDRSNFDSDDDFEDAVFEYAEELENSDYESPIASLADTLRYAGASDEAVAEAIDSVLEAGEIDLTEINDIIRRSYSEDFDTGEMLNNGQIMQNVLTDLGYKGVVDNTTGAKFANMGSGGMHTIVFPGNENLIRSINAKFDPENADSPNILASAPPILAPVAGATFLATALSSQEAEAGGLGSLHSSMKKARAESVKQAKEQGYDLDNVMYHASKQDIEEFVPGYSDGLIFLTPNKEFANDWLGKGKFQERQGGTGSIEGVRAEKKRLGEEIDKILESLPEDQRDQYYEEILLPRQQQLFKDERLADSAIYPVVTRTKKPFVPSKNVDVLEELYGKEYLDAPFGSGFATYRDALKDGNYLLYENKQVVDFLKSKGYDSMFLKESAGENKPFTTLAVFEPNNIRSVNAKFDPKKKDSPQILASAPFVGGAALAMGSVQDARAAQLAAEAAGAEVFMDAASGIVGPIVGGVAGLVEYLNPYSDREGKGERIKRYREGVGEALNYEPRSELGKDMSQSAMEGIAGLLSPVVQAVAPTARQFADYATNPDNVMDDYGLNVIPALYQGGKYIYEDIFGEPEREAVKSAIDVAL